MNPWKELRPVELDNRGLEPPEPMMRILAALKRMADDECIVAHNDREPVFLFPKLQALGFEYHVEIQPDESARIAIRKPGESGKTGGE